MQKINNSVKMKNIALFASGNGTNVQRIAEYFKNSKEVRISLVMTNNPEAGVLKRAENLNLPYDIFTKEQFYHSSEIIDKLKKLNIDLIVLAGFLWLVPSKMIKSFPDKIINIHPALLPKYGGKGMYGQHVHQAVIKNREKKSGITIHYVNNKYDEGQIIFQSEIEISNGETPQSLAEKIHQHEYKYFPLIIEKLLTASGKTKPLH